MLRVSEIPGGLVLAVPLWLGIATVLLGAALVASAVLGATPRGRAFANGLPVLSRIPLAPWRVSIGVVTAAIAILMGFWLVYAGVGFLRTSTTFEPRGVIVNGLRGEEDRVVWSQVRRQEIEELALGRGRAPYLLLYMTNGDYVPIGISGLASDETGRLQKFVAERIKR